MPASAVTVSETEKHAAERAAVPVLRFRFNPQHRHLFMRQAILAAMTMVAAGAGWAADPAQPTSTYFEAAKITVNARAQADGFMRVRVIPENGSPLEATMVVAKRMNENELARGLADSLNSVLAPDYVADKDNGEHVKIRKKAREAQNFSVEVTFNAPGFSVILDK